MICVTFARPTWHELLATHQQLVQAGVELVEWRLDFLDEPQRIAEMLPKRPGPVIVTCRLQEDGGQFVGQENQRRAWLSAAMQAGAEYVDLEEATAAALPRLGESKRVVSLHDFRHTPDDLASIHARLAALDADVVKLATFANHVNDCLRLFAVQQASSIPTAGLCMGELGMPSRLLAHKFGAVWTYACLDEEAGVAPGQVGFRQMRQLYRSDQATPETEVFGVIGDPIAHSYSPLLHNTVFRQLGLDKIYLPFRIPPDQLTDFLAAAEQWQVKGLSVTIPHKEAILQQVDWTEPVVRQAAAANTLVFQPQRTAAYNTDLTAAVESLRLAAAASGEKTLAGKQVLILGAGGASRAIACGLLQEKAKVTVTGRTLARAETLATELGCTAVAWDERDKVSCDIVINCTPIGMHPKVEATPYEADWLQAEMIVFDTVYNPEQTLLLKHAAARGCRTVSGIEMFIRQAADQLELFTGEEPPLEILHRTLRGALAEQG